MIVASGCIICIVKLFDEHGRMHVHHNASSSSVIDVSESLSSPLSLNTAQRFTMVRNDKFFMLTQYAKEAKHREGVGK
jgi:hypothetical protein